MAGSSLRAHALRLSGGQDLRAAIEEYAGRLGIRAGVVLSCVGNLERAELRMADERIKRSYQGTFEIVSLVGTFEPGNAHLHIALSDPSGFVFGGHLRLGSIVGITAELVLGELADLAFVRSLDLATSFVELVVHDTAGQETLTGDNGRIPLQGIILD